VTIVQDTAYPEEDTTRLSVHVAKPVRFALSIRVPGWLSGPPSAFLKGKAIHAGTTERALIRIDRTWQNGDSVRVAFPMSLRLEPIASGTPHQQAVMYGPILLVALADGPVTLHGDNAVEVVRPTDGTGLPSFRTHDGAVTFIPLYKVRDERYTTYVSTPITQ
jgi:DUF1680 family protein